MRWYKKTDLFLGLEFVEPRVEVALLLYRFYNVTLVYILHLNLKITEMTKIL